MNDLQTPTQEHLREARTETRLRSFRSDRLEAWGIVLDIPLIALVYGSWEDVPVAAAVAGVLAAILLGSTVISMVWRKLSKPHRNLEG